MKISKIEIKDYNQFRNFSLDLTYPAGHAKAGLPLDKVCFIGQSGTGKTTILNAISAYFCNAIHRPSSLNNYLNNLGLKVHSPTLLSSIGVNAIGNIDDFRVLYVPAEILIQEQILLKNQSSIRPPKYPVEGDILQVQNNKTHPQQVASHQVNLYNQRISRIENFKKEILIVISQEFGVDGWNALLSEIDEFDEELRKKGMEMVQKATTQSIPELLLALEQWKKDNPNPRIRLGEKCLNPILNKFNLEVTTEMNDKYFELQHTITKQKIEGVLSTGIKQILLTAMPIFYFNSENSIILFDEPERSLYPDVQREIISHYTSLAPTAQFFFATHSPVIASSFEPWEVVELQFDDEGYVQQRPYFEGERHVKNYTIYPQYLRWDSILIDMFGIDAEGNSARDGKLDELYSIKKQMQALSKNGGNGTPEMEALSQKYDAAATLLRWRFEK